MGRIFEKRKYSIFKTAAQNSKLYSKYSKQLHMAAKNGVPDPDANPVLRHIVERAKKENVPSHVIDKAIQKAAGAGGENYQPARYEGVGPGGSLVVVDCLTDNNTPHDLRRPQLLHQGRGQDVGQRVGGDAVRPPGGDFVQRG